MFLLVYIERYWTWRITNLPGYVRTGKKTLGSAFSIDSKNHTPELALKGAALIQLETEESGIWWSNY